MGVGATAPNAILTSDKMPASFIVTFMDILTIAISTTFLSIFKKEVAVISLGTGIFISAKSSFSVNAVWFTLRKNSSIFTHRSPVELKNFAWAPSTMSGVAKSAEGAALQRFPPIVAVVRIPGGPSFPAASRIIDRELSIFEEFSKEFTLVNDPIQI